MSKRIPRSSRAGRPARVKSIPVPEIPELKYLHKNGRTITITVDWFDADAIRWFISDSNGIEYHHGTVKNDNPDRAIEIARDRALHMVGVGL